MASNTGIEEESEFNSSGIYKERRNPNFTNEELEELTNSVKRNADDLFAVKKTANASKKGKMAGRE